MKPNKLRCSIYLEKSEELEEDVFGGGARNREGGKKRKAYKEEAVRRHPEEAACLIISGFRGRFEIQIISFWKKVRPQQISFI